MFQVVGIERLRRQAGKNAGIVGGDGVLHFTAHCSAATVRVLTSGFTAMCSSCMAVTIARAADSSAVNPGAAVLCASNVNSGRVETSATASLVAAGRSDDRARDLEPECLLPLLRLLDRVGDRGRVVAPCTRRIINSGVWGGRRRHSQLANSNNQHGGVGRRHC